MLHFVVYGPFLFFLYGVSTLSAGTGNASSPYGNTVERGSDRPRLAGAARRCCLDSSSLTPGLYCFPAAAVTGDHILSGFNDGAVPSHRSGGQESDVGLPGGRSRCQHGLAPRHAPEVPFQLPEAALFPGSGPLPLSSQPAAVAEALLTSISQTFLPSLHASL